MTSKSIPQPLDKIELIRCSLRCFGFGLVGVVPVLGVPFAFTALISSARLKRRQGAEWNPAGHFLFVGTLCARIGLAVTLLAVGIITILAITGYLSQP